jgi:hypothetical protein
MSRTDDVDPGQPHLHSGHLLSDSRERDDNGGQDGSLGILERGQFAYNHAENINLISTSLGYAANQSPHHHRTCTEPWISVSHSPFSPIQDSVYV